jgi:hypothetical protein
MRKSVTIVLAILVLLMTGAAESCKEGDRTGQQGQPGDFPAPVERPKANPTPGAPHKQPNKNAPETLQGPPVVDADPGPHNDSHFIVYQLTYVSDREVGGSVEFVDQNGHIVGPVQVKAERWKSGGGKKFGGQWEHIERAHLGIPMGFTWFPVGKNQWAMCTLIYNGEPVDYQIVPDGPCAVSWTLPKDLPNPKNPKK